MKVQKSETTATGEKHFVISTNQEEWMLDMPNMVMRRVIEMAAEQITKEFVEKHSQDIIKCIDQQAIATLVVAEAGNAVKDMLDKKLPDKIEKVVETQVYQRGFFGGISRIK